MFTSQRASPQKRKYVEASWPTVSHVCEWNVGFCFWLHRGTGILLTERVAACRNAGCICWWFNQEEKKKIHFQSKNVGCYHWHNGKGNVYLRTGHEGTDREYRYSSNLSSTSALDGGRWSAPRPGWFTFGKAPVPIVVTSDIPVHNSEMTRRRQLAP
jgi:hypothetical protein